MKLWLVGYTNRTGLVLAPDEAAAASVMADEGDCQGEPCVQDVSDALTLMEQNRIGLVGGMKVNP